jgi:hypothetical protein
MTTLHPDLQPRELSVILPRYYAHLDGPQPAEGLSLAAPDMRFLIAMPGQTVEGHSRDDLAQYIANRDASGRDRVHQIRVSAVQDNVEFHYGEVLEGGRRTGVLLSAIRTTPDGRFDRYLNLFETTVPLLDE